MPADLETRVSKLERTVRSEMEARMAMSQGITNLTDLVERRSAAQKRMLQAAIDNQKDNSESLRQLHGKVDGLVLTTNRLDTRMDKFDTRMGAFENRMGAFESRMATVEGDVRTLKKDVKALDIRMVSVEKKVDKLDTKMDTVIQMLSDRK